MGISLPGRYLDRRRPSVRASNFRLRFLRSGADNRTDPKGSSKNRTHIARGRSNSTKAFLESTVRDDALLTAITKAVILRLEEYTGRKFIQQNWDIYFDGFGTVLAKDWWDGVKKVLSLLPLIQGTNDLELPFGPLVSVGAINTYGDDDVANVMDSSQYSLDTRGPYGRIALKTGAIWPATVLRPVNSVEVYNAQFGYGNSETAVPSDIKHAIMLTVGKLWENRATAKRKFSGASGFTIPNTAQFLLQPYVRYKV